jgi:hypothetical protein
MDTVLPLEGRNLRFLNLDLDFFIDHIIHSPGSSKRRPGPRFKPWTRKQVRHFLENQCGLSREKPVCGRFVTHHDGAFDYWRELVDDFENPTQIKLVHVDAHADLGLGDGSSDYIMEDLLHQPLVKRNKPNRDNRDGLNLGSYVAFAVACRWIKSIVFVTHPEWRDDLPPWYFRNCDVKSGFLELKCFPRGTINYTNIRSVTKEVQPLHTEPLVPFSTCPHSDFEYTASFDRALLCQSPNYASRAADNLISVFADYIEFH